MARLSELFLNKERAKGATAIMELPLGASIEIRYLNNGDVDWNKISKMKDKEGADEQTVDFLIFNWFGIEDDHGDNLPCSLENKMTLVNSSEGLLNEIMNFSKNPYNFVDSNEVDQELEN